MNSTNINLSIINIHNFTFIPNINYDKIESFNNNNKIFGFNLMFLKKESPICPTVNESFVIKKTKFNISSQESLKKLIQKLKNINIMKIVIL